MGVILDSTVIVASERKREAQDDLILRIIAVVGDQHIALSAVSYGELVHGLHREISPERFAARRRALDNLRASMAIYPYTVETAELAGRIDAEQKLAGLSVPFPDLLIGATALSLGYSVLTSNLRHFRLIPNLHVIPF